MGDVAQDFGAAEIQFTSQDEGPGSGSMVGGSLPPAHESNPKKANGPVTTYEAFTAAVEQLIALVKIGKNVKGKVAEGKTPSLKNMLELSTKTSETLGALVATINNIPNGGKPRDAELNQCLLPMARQAWLKTPPVGNAKFLLDIEGQYVEPLDDDNQPIPKDPEDDTEAQKFSEKRLKGVQPYLALVERGNAYPDIEPYLRRSEKIRAKLDEIRERMFEAKEAVDSAQKVIDTWVAKGKTPDDNYYLKVENAQAVYDQIKEEIPPLFEDVSDVQAHEVAEALAAITIESSASIGVLSKFLESSWSIERLIVAAVLAEHHPSVNAEKIKAPLLTGEGRVEMTERELDRDELIALAKDEQRLSELFRTLEQARDLIEALLPTLSSIPELNQESARKVKKILRQPFTANDQKVNKEVLERLFAFQSGQVNAALAETLTKRAMVDLDREKWTLPIEGVENIDVLRWVLLQKGPKSVIAQLPGIPTIFNRAYQN